MRVGSVVLFVIAVVASAASAQAATRGAPPSSAANMDLAVTDAIRSVLAGKFDNGHIAMLQALGHQQAVASTCPGFAIDADKFTKEFDLIYDDDQGKPRTFASGERPELERKATLALGMAFGAHIAIAANDHKAFCEAAARERAGSKLAHLVWAK